MAKIKRIRIKSADDLFKQPIGEPFEVENLQFELEEIKTRNKKKARVPA